MNPTVFNRLVLAALISASFVAPAGADTFHFRVASKGVVGTAAAPQLQLPDIAAWTLPGVTFGVSPFALTAPSSTSGGGFSYSSADPSVAQVSGNVVTVVGAGAVEITASQAAAGQFSAGAVTGVLTIAKATPTLGTYTLPFKTVGDPSYQLPTPTASVSGGSYSYSSSNTAVATVSNGWVSLVGAGSTTITATRLADRNYNQASTSATLNVAPAPSPANTAWNSADKGSNLTLVSPVVVKGTGGGGTWQIARANVGKSSGKFVFELLGSSNGQSPSCGLADASASLNAQLGTSGISLGLGGNGSYSKSTMVFSNRTANCSSTVMLAVDLDAGKGWIATGNAWYDNGDPAQGLNPSFTFPPNTMLYPAASMPTGYTYTVTANFGTSAFKTLVPAGFTPGWY